MRLALLMLALALPAIAETPKLRSSAAITLVGRDSLQRVALPFEAYRDARADLGDVRVLNARGEPVPIARAGEPDKAREAPVLTELPMFPLMQPPSPKSTALGTEISVRAADGTLVAIKPSGAVGTAEPQVRSYVLDASKLEVPMQALVLDWVAAPGREMVHLRLESSDDLKSWNTIAESPVTKMEFEGRVLSQPRVAFQPTKAKYLRLRWSNGEFALKSARAETQGETQPPPRTTHLVNGTPGANALEFFFDLGARLPVEKVRLVLAEANAVVSATLYTREDDKVPWQLVTGAPFYRLQRGGSDVQSPAVDIGRHAARYWMARLANGSSGGPGRALEVQWRPDQLVFVAQGDPPFSLAFGNSSLTSVALPVSDLIPSYHRLAELKLPEARTGPVTTAPPPGRWEKMVSETNYSRLALWALLLAGVVVLGYMAWRLARQMREPQA